MDMRTSPGSADADAFDPVTLEIFWSRLISIADEAAVGLLRTAFSTIVRESNDYATVLMDRDGNSVSENTGGIASFSCILPRTTKTFLERFPAETWRPGDCVITNDPWLATGHLPDFTFVSPIFHRGALVGFAGSIAHSPDVGGALWSADCRELFEEGIRIPPARFLREGVRNEELIELILANVRVPRQVLGDFEAQVTANEVCVRRVEEFLQDVGLADLQLLARTVHARADIAMRRAIAAVPDGIYRATLEADGFDEQLTRLACAVTVAGDTMHIDYAGTSPQIDRGINCVFNYTHAYSVYPVKCSLDPFTPRNEGTYRAITVAAPERSILNPEFPAPVGARQLTGHLLAGVIYRALADVIPDRVIAECGAAPSMRALFSGVDRNGDRFSQVLFATGGMGASPHRDGLSTTSFPDQCGRRQHRGVRERLAAGGLAQAAAPGFGRAGPLPRRPRAGGRDRGSLARGRCASRSSPIAAIIRRSACSAAATARRRSSSSPTALARIRNPAPPSLPARGCAWSMPAAAAMAIRRQRDLAAVKDDLRDGYITAAAAREYYGLDQA